MVHIPFEPREFQYGAALFCVVPTTLTSGVTMVRIAPPSSSHYAHLTFRRCFVLVIAVDAAHFFRSHDPISSALARSKH